MTDADVRDLSKTLLNLWPSEAKALIGYMARELSRIPPSRMPVQQIIDDHQGVYLIYDHDGRNLLYVGETGNLRERRGDLDRTMNHTFRRHFGNDRYSSKVGFKVVKGSKTKFPPEIEEELTKEIAGLQAVFAPVGIGRAEIEECIVDEEKGKGRGSSLYNIKEKRKA